MSFCPLVLLAGGAPPVPGSLGQSGHRTPCRQPSCLFGQVRGGTLGLEEGDLPVPSFSPPLVLKAAQGSHVWGECCVLVLLVFIFI